MQLIFDKQLNFEPVRGNLKQWKGYVGTIEGTEIPIFANIYIQDGFPEVPPFADITPKVNHPNVEDDGTLSLRILAEWRSDIHIFQVIEDIKNLCTNVPAKPYKTKVKKHKREERISGLTIAKIPIKELPQVSLATTSRHMVAEKQTLDDSIVEHQSEIEKISREIEKERESLLKKGGIETKTKELAISREEDLQAEFVAIQDTLEVVQEKFEDGDMTNIEYLKLHKRYTKKVLKLRNS